MICSGRDTATGDCITVEFDHRIRDITPGPPTDLWIAPGFIDLQVNGFAGVDFNRPEASADEIQRALERIVSTGVTRCLPTVITGPPGEMLACLRNLARVQSPVIAGFHVEGPHISPEDGPRGAHPLDSVRAPDLAEYRRWQEATDDRIRLITLSPHWPDAIQYIRAIVRDGVTASIGHTSANSEQIAAAVDAGATLSTHIGNAGHTTLPKIRNYIWDQLAEDRLSASFIADGIHLPAAFLRAALRAKTVSRSILATDASAPAGAASGRYRLGAQDADLTPDGRVVLSGTDRLAGSALKMNDAIANVMRMAGVTQAEAVRMATVNPARIIGLNGRQNGLTVGERADLALFRTGSSIGIESVRIEGQPAAIIESWTSSTPPNRSS